MMAEHRRIVPPPSIPTAVARKFIEAMYMTVNGPRLRHHRGVPHIWNGRNWPEVAPRDLRSIAYQYLEKAEYVDKDGDLVPWAPTQRRSMISWTQFKP